VKVTELATGSLDHTDILAAGVVGSPSALPASQFSIPTRLSMTISRLVEASRCRETYVSKSRGRHCDGIPGDSDGGVTAIRVSDVRWRLISDASGEKYRT
jgi:hypothetical protein